jgi:hydroxymethylbilane synthase
MLAPLLHHTTWAAVTAERGFLRGLGGGCAVPIAAYAVANGGRLHLHARVLAADGSACIDVHDEADTADAEALGMRAAARALAQGAQALLEAV